MAGGEEGGAMTEPESREETARQLLDDAITKSSFRRGLPLVRITVDDSRDGVPRG